MNDKSKVEKREPFTYTPKTEQELENLAWGILGGQIWGSWSAIENPEVHFMPLMFLDQETAKELEAAEIVHAYEHISKAGSHSVNGLPMFFSCHFLSKPDAVKLQERINEIQAFKDARAKVTNDPKT